MTVAFFMAASGDNQDPNASWRIVVPTINGPQDQVRVRFCSGTLASGVGQANNCSIGVSTGTNANTVATPVELLFGGVSGFSFAKEFNNQPIYSDWVNFNGWNAGDKLVVTIDLGAPANLSLCRTTVGVPAGSTTFTYGTVTPPGITYNQATPAAADASFSEVWAIDLIEVRTAPVLLKSKSVITPKRTLFRRQKAF
jgi:hypothetical protein